MTMDRYMGSSFEDLIVPMHQESFDAFASPDAWSRWGISSPEAPEKCFIMDGYDLMNNGITDGLYSQIETGMSDQSDDLNAHGDFCNGSSLQDFNGIEQMDDIFLNSILEDVPRSESLQTSICSVSSSSDLRLKPEDEMIFEHSGLDVQSFSSSKNSIDTSACVDSLGAFHLSDGLHNSEVPMSQYIPCNSGQYHGMPLKESDYSVVYVSEKGQPEFTILDQSEEKSSSINFSEESSLEEFVLQDLQRVVGKLTDKTRMCFRDTFYRLAKNSQQKSVSTDARMEEFTTETPCTRRCDEQGERTRSRRKHQGTESKTNTIDRAIANLTFNNMESNICEFPLPEKVTSRSRITRTIKRESPRSTKLAGAPGFPAVCQRNSDQETNQV